MAFCAALLPKNSITLTSVHRNSNVNKNISDVREHDADACRTIVSESRYKITMPANYKVFLQMQGQWIVKNLPLNLEINEKKSPILAKYLLSIKNKHNDLINDMNSELQEIANEISEQIHQLGEDYKTETTACEQVVRLQWQQLQQLDYEDLERQREEQKIIVHQMNKKQEELLKFLYKDLKECEKERSEKMKRVFFKYSIQMEKIGYIMPFEVQMYFENLILSANQQLLNNACVHTNLLNILSKSISQDKCEFNKHVEQIMRNAARDNLDIQSKTQLNQQYPGGTEKITLSILQQAITELETTIGQINQGLRVSINMLFLDMLGSLRYRKSVLNISSEKPLHVTLSRIPILEPYFMNEYNIVENIKLFLNNVLDIWNAHCDRIEKEVERIQKEIELNAMKSVKSLEGKLKKLPECLTTIIQGDARKVKKVSRKALKEIQALKSLISASIEKEQNIAKSLKGFWEQEQTIFVELCTKFLANNKRESLIQIPMEPNLPMALKTCKFSILALLKWKIGLHSAIQANITSSAGRIDIFTKEFIEPVLNKINEKYDSYASQTKVIEIDINNATEIRKAELNFHSTRAKEHCAGVKKILAKMRKGFKKATDKTEYKQQCVKKIHYLQSSNDKFLSKIREFPIGNFTRPEAKKIIKKLSKNTSKLKTEEQKWSS